MSIWHLMQLQKQNNNNKSTMIHSEEEYWLTARWEQMTRDKD